MKRSIAKTAIFVTVFMPTVSLAQDGGRIYASQCAGCHGTNGHTVADIDNIGGKSAKELYEELKEMKAKTKTNNIMHRQAKGYTDQQIRELAVYLASVNGKSTTLPK